MTPSGCERMSRRPCATRLGITSAWMTRGFESLVCDRWRVRAISQRWRRGSRAFDLDAATLAMGRMHGARSARLVVIALAVTAMLAGCGSGHQPSQAAISSCDGSAELCGRRLNEVVFPGTHNSFAAADEPGWYFANQTYPISRQLEDCIRAMLIDVHFGFYDPSSGRVRTDLTAEGSDRNKVAKQVPAEALRVA